MIKHLVIVYDSEPEMTVYPKPYPLSVRERINRPCPIHGKVAREIEGGWTDGLHYFCPKCKDTEEAWSILSDALKAMARDKYWFPDFAAILGSAMRHLRKTVVPDLDD